MITLWLLACSSGGDVVDADGDGFFADVDCDDADADAFPGALEFCDGRDNDCNGSVDDDPLDARPFYEDADGDGYGAEPLGAACAPAPGSVRDAGDCDDGDAEVHPNVAERCDGVDDDCDGAIDEEPGILWLADVDGDGHGSPSQIVDQCTQPDGYVGGGSLDCDDTEPSVHPGADEVCDGVDQDCDGQIDGPNTPFSVGPSLPVTLSSHGPGGLALESVDLTSIGSPSSVRIAWGDCQSGFTEVPARFVDRWSAVGRPGPDLDGIGVLAVVLDDLSSPTDARLYADAGAAGDVVSTALGVTNGDIHLSFDGALGAVVSDAIGPVFEQIVHAPSLRTPAGVVELTPTQLTLDVHPALTIATTSSTSVGAGADVDVVTEWFVFSGRPEVWFSTRITANAAFVLSGSPTWADGVASFAGDVDGESVRDGLLVHYPDLEIGLYDAEPAGPSIFAADHVRVPGVTGSTDSSPVAAGAEVASARVVLATAPLQGLESTPVRLQPTARVLVGEAP